MFRKYCRFLPQKLELISLCVSLLTAVEELLLVSSNSMVMFSIQRSSDGLLVSIPMVVLSNFKANLFARDHCSNNRFVLVAVLCFHLIHFCVSETAVASERSKFCVRDSFIAASSRFCVRDQLLHAFHPLCS